MCIDEDVPIVGLYTSTGGVHKIEHSASVGFRNF